MLSGSWKSITANHIDTYNGLSVSFTFSNFIIFVLIPNMIELFIFIQVLFLSYGGTNKMPQTDSCLGGFPGWSPTFEKREKEKEKENSV